MMKSALFKSYSRESAVGVSGYMRKCGISLRSLLGQSRSSTNSQARQTPLRVRQSVGFVFSKSKCGWYRGNYVFPSRIL